MELKHEKKLKIEETMIIYNKIADSLDLDVPKLTEREKIDLFEIAKNFVKIN